FQQVAIHPLDGTRLRQRCDRPWNAIDKPPRLAFLSLGFVVGRRGFTCSLSDEKARLLQPDGRLIRGDSQEERVGLLRKVEVLRTGDDDSEVALKSQRR